MLKISLEATHVPLCVHLYTQMSHAKAILLSVSAGSMSRRTKSCSVTVFTMGLEWVSAEKVNTSKQICIQASLKYKINLYFYAFLTTKVRCDTERWWEMRRFSSFSPNLNGNIWDSRGRSRVGRASASWTSGIKWAKKMLFLNSHG